jgi:hypothetical protein
MSGFALIGPCCGFHCHRIIEKRNECSREWRPRYSDWLNMGIFETTENNRAAST